MSVQVEEAATNKDLMGSDDVIKVDVHELDSSPSVEKDATGSSPGIMGSAMAAVTSEKVFDVQEHASGAMIKAYTYWHKPWRAWYLVAQFIGLMAALLGSVGTWQLTLFTGIDSLGILTGQLMDNIGLQVEESMYGKMLPLTIFLRQGYETAYLAQYDLTTQEGQMAMVAQNTAFLETYLGSTRCCTGMFTNMWYHGVDARGRENEIMNKANEDDYADDKAQFNILVANPPPDPNWHIYGLYKDGNSKNPTVMETFDEVTARPKDPYRYPAGVAVNQSIGNRVNWGFNHWPKNDGFWYKTVREKDLAEGEFTFSRVFMWDINKPVTLKTHGIIPIYYPQCGVDKSRCPGMRQKRVGAWVVGFKLHFLSQYLSNLQLKGGFIFFVERETGNFIASSDAKFDSFRTIVDETTKKVSYAPYEATAADFPVKKVKSRVHWLLHEREGKMTWADVKAGAAEVEIGDEGVQFIKVTSLTQFGVDWIGVISIPWESVMKELNETKFRTLLLGMLIVGCIKAFLETFRAYVQTKMIKSAVIPGMKKTLEDELLNQLQALTGRRSSRISLALSSDSYTQEDSAANREL